MAVYQIELDDEDDAIIREEIALGRFGSPAEVLKAGLESLRQELAVDSAWIDRLRAAAQIGMKQYQNGEFTALESAGSIGDFVRGLRPANFNTSCASEPRA